MPKALPPIHESSEELLHLLNTLPDRERRTRVHAVFLAKMGYGRSRKDIAATLHVNAQSVERWFKHYEKHGLHSLLTSHRTKCGKKPRIQGEVLSQLQEKLNTPEGFKGYERIRIWLQDQFGLDVPYKTVHQTVYYKLNAKPKVPRKSNVRKDPEKEETFKKKRLPNN
jgi:transposase